jgi:hypothetical protein
MCSQTVYFNRQYNPNGTWGVGLSVFSNASNYLIFSVGGDSTQYYRNKITPIKLNKNGDLLYFSNTGDTLHEYYAGVGGSVSRTADGYILAGSVDVIGYTESKGLLIRYDSSGSVLWSRTYRDSTFVPPYLAGFQTKTTELGSFISVGEIQISQSTSRFLLLKSDSFGNELWRRQFGYPQNMNRCESIQVLPDGGFLLGGTTGYVYQSNSINSLVVRTDSMGNQLWMKTYGGPYNDGYARLALAKDGNYVIGTTYTEWVDQGISISRINFIKTDVAGNVIWNKKFCKPRIFTELTNIKALEEGGFVAVGYTHDCDTATYDHLGWIMKISENGDSLWYREYSNYHSAYYRHELYDVAQTSDGGFIACGTINDDLNNLFYDMWVLKLDSNGCLNPGCTQSINEYGIRNQGIEIYPNPFTESFTLQMPEKIVDAEVYVFDMLGKQVMKTSINSHRSSIPASGLEKGIYLIRVVTRDGEVFIGKGVKN